MSHKILVVEDSATQAEFLRLLLEEHGYAVTVARSAEAAMALLPEGDFDLVLSDVVMPGADGYALTRYIKHELHRHGLMVVLLTTLSDPLDIVRGLASGADNYVTKPFDTQILLARVRQVLAARERRRTMKASLGVQVEFLGVQFTITSDKEQILDLLLSSVEDAVRTNHALQESQRHLAEAHEQLRGYADRMRTQAQVSTSRYQALMQEVWDAIFILDPRGTVLETNARAARLLDELAGPASAAGGRPLASLVASAERARLAEALARLPAERHVEVCDLPLGDGSGREAYCDLSLALAPGEGEELVIAIAHDTTERRESERRLRKSEERARTILDSLSEGVLLVTSGGQIQWCNRSAGEFLGMAPEAVRGRSVAELKVEFADEAGAPLRPDQLPSETAMRTGQPVARLMRLTAPGRPSKWVFASARSIARNDDAGADTAVVSLVDLTERKRVEEQLLQSQRLEAVGRLAGGVAHDFNNILTVIKWSCDVALESTPPDAEISADLEEIRKAADRATALTRQLLTFSRRKIVVPQPLSLNAVVTNMETILQRLIREDIELSISLDPALPSVVGDPGQLEQVLLNLVVNARDAMPDGGRIVVETRSVYLDADDAVGLGGLAPGAFALLVVSDTGVGMPPEVRNQIFEPFFTTKEPGKGTGLGLATVYGIVKEAGGQIAVYSEPGHGTTFKIYLPLTDRAPVAAVAPASGPASAGAGETILLAEDEDAVRRVVGQELRRIGYQVLEAKTGDDALRIAAEHRLPIHVLITDMIMPGMSGRALAAAILRGHPEARVLYTSGYSGEILSGEMILEHGCAFLEKPFSIGDLASRVRTLLEDGPRRAEAVTARARP